jgi:hypothetical protein
MPSPSRERLIAAHLSQPCGQCGAAPGRPCLSTLGNAVWPHLPRFYAATAAGLLPLKAGGQ